MAMLCPAAGASARPVLLELFTSQSCSSCPPAEALLTALQAGRADILALEFHVDYWNALRWRDPYSSPAATDRQRHYAAALNTEVFTPQMVIDGTASALGSDRAAVLEAVQAARASQAEAPALTMVRSATGVTLTVGAGRGTATVLLIGYDEARVTRVTAGENAGTVLPETHLVRSIATVASWRGQQLQLMLPVPPGQVCAVILQRDDGTVLAVAPQPGA